MLRNRPRWFFLACVAGFVAGAAASTWLPPSPPLSDGKPMPLPHHIPLSKDAAVFRFAMVHDVLHERFPKHGRAFYEAREARARGKLKALAPDSDEAFALYDDIAAGQDRLGKPSDAVATMREKERLQKAKGLSGLATYTTSANLGTFLIHANMGKALAGDESGRAVVREGLDRLKDALRTNPDSHFGREKWQVALAEFLLAVSAKPELLKTFDCFGNRLDHEFASSMFDWAHRYEDESQYARPFSQSFLMGGSRGVAGLTRLKDDEERSRRRSTLVTHIGAEEGWEAVDVPSHRQPVAFDEPVLGVIGMWRQGGGANPHFALTIGETMLRVGQREIAWSAFERAKRIAECYSRDAGTQQFLRDHCDRRQAFIERTIGRGTGEEWRKRFDAELAFGEGYQRRMQDHEAAKLTAGADVYDPKLLDDFHRDNPSVATTPGAEEYALIGERGTSFISWRVPHLLAFGLLGAGLTAILMSARFRRRPQPVK
jgi:hypothetical protein